MKIKLVADSSANIFEIEGAAFGCVPLKIVAGDEEYVDDARLDVESMISALKIHKGKSGSACPGTEEWLEAFGDNEAVFGVAITSRLSGCYNSARLAAEEYMEQYPGRKVFILDSRSAGPEIELILEKYIQLIGEGRDFDEICREIMAYKQRTRLLFSLESVKNLARNGRVNPAVAAAVGLLGIRIVGRASNEGTLEPMHKCRGEKKALEYMLRFMKQKGYSGGKVRISHSFNLSAAEQLRLDLLEAYPGSDIRVRLNGGLCSFYAEEGGLLVGFEGR